MTSYLGIDVGAISIKAALLTEVARARAILDRNGTGTFLRLLESARDRQRVVLVTPYRRTRGRPVEAMRRLLDELAAHVDLTEIGGVVCTGSGEPLLTEAVGGGRCNEFQALTRAVDWLAPEARTLFELGGETSKFIALEPDPSSGRLGIADYGTNGDCAAGTGAFLDQQAGRLQFAIEDVAGIVASADRTAQIAGRCSVFAKSDMIHAQQKGFTPDEVLRGLCKAVATNYKAAVTKGRAPTPPVLFVGGVAANAAVVNELREVFNLSGDQLRVPEAAESYGAIGSALLAAESRAEEAGTCLQRLRDGSTSKTAAFRTSPPLSLERVKLLRDQVEPYRFDSDGEPIDAYLGLDIGSVGTKLVVIDDEGTVVDSIFTRTQGRPIEVVSRSLRQIEQSVGARVRIRGVGTTGSGRELIGELVGADSITDEITCHKTGATFVGDRLLGRRPDTIFEIGGQDSKYISLEAEGGDSSETIVVDFTMNEACAAGTGSFLEERAEELGVSIKDEFAAEALRSKAPIKLGERCTVFMERDVNTCMQRGALREDVIAGLAYSVVYNYINRVVRGRPVGDYIFFQGGTAYNDAVAAAFSQVTGKEIIVPPHNALLGAIGAALLARERVMRTGATPRFRGYDLDAVNYTLREFTCRGCGNLCAIQEFNVEGEKTYWGDKCSDRYRKRSKADRKPTIPDLVALRKKLLDADMPAPHPDGTPTIGIPLAMYTHDLLPLWRRFFHDCGFNVVVSTETNRTTVRAGYDTVVAEPCFPIIVAHGHAAELVAHKVDYLWLPNIMSGETKFLDNESHVCPWGQTLPFVLRQAPAFRHWPGRTLAPTIHFRKGEEGVRTALLDVARELGVPRRTARKAFDAGWSALTRFQSAYQAAGTEAFTHLVATGQKGIVVVGRPYNIHDAGVSLATARKLRDLYGVNVIPIDALPLADVDIRDINDNMYWEYGRRVLAAARRVADHPNLHLIYITNFKCGPDSFVKGFVRAASGKPFLTLQFDGHSNDAGVMTRCEAYLDSKGFLRWWRTSEAGQSRPQTTSRTSGAEPSTSRRWPTPAHDSWAPSSERSGSMRSPHPIPTPKR